MVYGSWRDLSPFAFFVKITPYRNENVDWDKEKAQANKVALFIILDTI